MDIFKQKNGEKINGDNWIVNKLYFIIYYNAYCVKDRKQKSTSENIFK